MEALPISPTKANAKSATAPVSGGLSALFQALLQESTLRLDTRASILPSMSTTREAFEPGRDAGRGPRPSAAFEPETRVHSTDTRSRTQDAPETPAAPTTAADNGADGETEPATGGFTDPEVQPTGDDPAPAPDESPETEETASAGLPGPAQDVAANTAAGKAQALGKDSFGAPQVLLRMAPQAQAATSATPAATTLAATTLATGPNGAAARVQVTPAGLVAPPNAALGGGAAITAMTAEAGQAGPANQPAQTGVSAATSALNNAASSVAAAQNALRAAVRATGAGPASNAGTGAAQSQSAQTGIAPAGTSPAADIPAQLSHAQTTAPHNAQTPFNESNNTQAQNGNSLAAASTNRPTPDARAANMLAQNANGAPTPVAEGVVWDGQRTPQAPESQTRAAHPDQAQHPTARGPEAGNAAIAASQAGNTAKAQNAQTTGQPAPAGAAQRIEGVANQSTNLPGAAPAGLGHATARTPGMLPAQARPATAQPVPVDQVAVHISKAVRAGEDRIRIRLHPAELGQIDVKLKLGADGLVKAIVSVVKPETFDLLQKDARGLERALQEAGLKTDSGSLSFHLRGENHQETGEHGNEPEFGQLAAEPEHQTDELSDNAPPPAHVMSDYAIDIRV